MLKIHSVAKITAGSIALLLLLLAGYETAGYLKGPGSPAQVMATSQEEADESIVQWKGLAVRGIVRDPTGRAVENVVIGLPPGYGFGERTDSRGEFMIRVRQMDLPTDAPSFLMARDLDNNLAIAVEISHSVDGLTVNLAPAARVIGRCMDEQGTPLAGARLRMSLDPAPGSGALWHGAGFAEDEVTADEGGRFEFTALPITRDFDYRLLALADGTRSGQWEYKKSLGGASLGAVTDVGDLVLHSSSGGQGPMRR